MLSEVELLPKEKDKPLFTGMSNDNNEETIDQEIAAIGEEEPTPPENNNKSTITDTTQNTTSPPADAVNQTERRVPEFKSSDEFFDYIGYNDIPERKFISSEERQERLAKRNKLSALGEAFKLLVEAGGASQGMYVDKREPNPWMEKTEAKIQELKDKDLLEQRRIENEKINDALRKTGMYGNYVSQQSARDHSDEQMRKNQEYRTEERKDQNEFTKEQREQAVDDQKELIQERAKYDKGNDKEFLEWKANLEAEKQKEISQARTEDDIKAIEARYQSMLDYQKQLLDIGIKESKAGYQINGQSYTPEQIDMVVADAIEKGVELPEDIKYKLSLGKELTDIEKLIIAKKVLGVNADGQSTTNQETPEWIEESQPGMFMNMPEDEEETSEQEDFYGRTSVK